MASYLEGVKGRGGECSIPSSSCKSGFFPVQSAMTTFCRTVDDIESTRRWRDIPERIRLATATLKQSHVFCGHHLRRSNERPGRGADLAGRKRLWHVVGLAVTVPSQMHGRGRDGTAADEIPKQQGGDDFAHCCSGAYMMKPVMSTVSAVAASETA